MTYLLYVFIYFCLTNELLSSPNDIFAELWENNLQTKNTSTNDQKVEPYEEQSFGVGKKASGFRVLRIKEEPHEETGDYGREYYGTVQVKQETDDGAVQVKHERDDGAVQVKQETDDGTFQVKQETDDGAVQVKHEADDGAVQIKHQPQLDTVQVQEEYLFSDGDSLNSSPGGSDYEKNNDFEETDSLSNEEQQKSEKKIIKKIISDNDKKKILKTFLAKKERLANEFGSTPKSKLEEIARELGTCFRTIRKWRFNFGMGYEKPKHQSKRLSDDQREKIIKKFDKMKEKRIRKNKFAKRAEIEEEIARELGLSKLTINTWKVKFGKNNFKHYSREEKLKILKKFEKVKNENKGKTIEGSSYDKEKKIAKELGVSRSTIWQWKKDFGISKLHCFTESERLKLIKKYFKMIKQNPHLSGEDIAAKLNISRRTISRWISELKNKISENNTDSDSTNEDVLTHHQTFIDENAWAWNRCTKRN